MRAPRRSTGHYERLPVEEIAEWSDWALGSILVVLGARAYFEQRLHPSIEGTGAAFGLIGLAVGGGLLAAAWSFRRLSRWRWLWQAVPVAVLAALYLLMR